MREYYIWAIGFISFGYIIVMPLSLLLGIASSSLNFYIRAAELGLVLLILFFSVLQLRSNRGILLPLIIFFMIYGFRLINDVLFNDILMIYQSPIYVLGYFFGLTLIPVIAISLLYRHEDVPMIFRDFLILLVAANIMLMLYALIFGNIEGGNAFSGRVQAASELEGAALLGPIWIGLAGAMLASMLFGILATRRGTGKLCKIVAMLLMAIAGSNILFGASRGPVVGLALSILLFLFCPGRIMADVAGGGSRWRGWAITFGIIALSSLIVLFSESSIFLVDRFAKMYEEGLTSGVEARYIIYKTAWQDFLSSPLIGTSYVVSFENSSPHNIVLESLMATGILGSSFLFIALWRALRGIIRLLRGLRGTEGTCLALLAVVQLAMGLTSGSISQSPGLWISVALVTVMGTPESSLCHQAHNRKRRMI